MSQPSSPRAKRMRPVAEALLWVTGIAASALFAYGVYDVASRPFVTTVDSKVALPKELAVTASEAQVRLPPIGEGASADQPAPTDTPTTDAPSADSSGAQETTSTTVTAEVQGNTINTQAPANTSTTSAPAATPTTPAPTTAAPTTAAPTTAAPTTAAPTTQAPPNVLPTPDASSGNNGLVSNLLDGLFGSSNEGEER